MIQYFLKLLLSLGMFGWLLWSGEIRFEAFRELVSHRIFVALIMLTQAVLFLLAAVRWQLLARAFSIQVSYLRILKFFLMGEFFSLFFLGAMGGDFSRMLFLGAEEPRKKMAAVLTVLFDKITALWVLCGIGFVALMVNQPLVDANQWLKSMQWLLALPLVGVPAGFLLLRWIPATLTAAAGKFGRFEEFLILRDQLSRMPVGVYAKIAALNALAQSFVIINFVCCAFALGAFHVPLATFLCAVPLGFIALALPFSIGGLGVGQFAFVELFKLYGVTERALGGNLSTLHIAVWALFALLGGLLFAASKGEKRELVNGSNGR